MKMRRHPDVLGFGKVKKIAILFLEAVSGATR